MYIYSKAMNNQIYVHDLIISYKRQLFFYYGI